MVGILVSFWDGLFSGAMLVSGRVDFSGLKPLAYLNMLVFFSGLTHRKSLLCVVQLTPFPTSHLAIYIDLHESSMVC